MEKILVFIFGITVGLLICWAMPVSIDGQRKAKKWGILIRLQSWWIGAHWSDYNKRLCVNLIPFVTIWIAEPDGVVPEQGVDIYRSDSDERGSWGG